MRIWLLGGFGVSVGSRPIEGKEWRLRKVAALVKLLALAPGHCLHREQAMELLWPDSSTKAAANNLRQVLYAARRVLDPASDSHSRYLSLEDEQLTLCPEGRLWVDVEVFEAEAASARGARDPAVYRAAIDLYAGDLLPEDSYEEWVESRRGELRQLYLTLLLELSGLYEERDEPNLTIDALRTATAHEPTLEEAHAPLMRLQALSGRPEQALAQYERLRDTLSRALGTEPGAAARRLRDEIAAGRLSSAMPAGSPPREERQPSGTGKHNLPAPRTSFVGRKREMLEVKRLLSMTRLLTLTGAGGSGKTRLAIEVARDLVGAYPDGVWMVELAPLSEPDLVAQAVAGALEIPERPGQPLTDTLLDALGDKELLLVVDNCEHLVEAAARLVDALLDSCPRLRVVATTRELLGVAGEVTQPVPPLSLPATTDEGFQNGTTAEGLVRYEAVRLFVERARLRLPDFELTQHNALAVAKVCRKLDGIPLAIELATTRMGALAVEQVAQRLEVSLDVLSGASRTAEARQRALRATLDWSHDLLSETERALFARLCVFAGGWTLEAAEAVCAGGSIDREGVLDLLGGLVDKSLVVAGAARGGEVRYRMLEPIRQYVREKLEESGEFDEVQGRHAAFFLALAEEAAPELSGPEQRLWGERLEGEHDNLREALSWVLTRGEAELGLRFCGALWQFWFTRGYLSEGVRWHDQALAGGGQVATPARVKALEGMGWLTQSQGDAERAKAAYAAMLELSRQLRDKASIATALNSLGTLAVAAGDNERAKSLLEENLAVLRELEEEGSAATTRKRYYTLNLLGILAINEEDDYARGAALWEEGLTLVREIGDMNQVGATLCNLGYAALLQGEYERATALCEEALTLARHLEGGGIEIVPETLINLGLAAREQGYRERASAFFEEALTVSRRAGMKASLINALEGMVGLAGAVGDEDTRAAHLWGTAEKAREVTGIALPPAERALHEPYLAGALARLGEAAYTEALAEGRAISLEEATEYALFRATDEPEATISEEVPPAAELMGRLTRREQEVALLVAQGLTNRQISTGLGISERTAGNHVATILRKSGLRSRAQIAARATER